MTIEEQYNLRIDAMLPRERIARSFAMLEWTREMLGRQIQQEHLQKCDVELSAEELKWCVARRLYANEPAVLALIERRMADVSA